MPLRIGILSQWYYPEPVLIPKTIADACVRDGHTVRVLTGYPNYPGGKLYSGYHGSSACMELLDSAEVLRLPTYLSHDQSAVRRVLTFLSFVLKSVQHRAFLQDCDVIYVYGTPMTTALAATLLRIRRRIPYVIHLQDLWPESVLDSGMLKSPPLKILAKHAITTGLKFLYSLAEHIVVISPGMKEALLERGVATEKISVLLNWDANEDEAIYAKSASRESAGRLRCTYAGNIGVMQDIETIVRAASAVQDEIDLDVAIYGSGVAEDQIKVLANQLDAKNVTFHGRVSNSEMKKVYEQSDYFLVTLKDRDVFRMTIPSKFQSALSNGVPIITTVAGDLAAICKENKLGLVADPESSTSLANSFRRAAELGLQGREVMAARSKKFYWEKLSASQAIRNIMVVLKQAAKSQTGK